MNEISIDDEIKEIIDETSKWTKLFESFCFKSKFIIEKQQNLLKKLHYENNILKNEASQLKSTNSRLVTKLRSRLQPHTSPVGVAVKGTHLVEKEAYSEILSPPMVNPPTPGAPINSPIFPNLVQHNLGSSEHHSGLPESDIEGISALDNQPDQQVTNNSPMKPKSKTFLESSGSGTTSGGGGGSTGLSIRSSGENSKTEKPKTPRKTPKKSIKSSPNLKTRLTPKKPKRSLNLPPSSPDVKKMKQLKMDMFSPAKTSTVDKSPHRPGRPGPSDIVRSSPKNSPRSKSPAQSPFKLPKSPRSRFFVRIETGEKSKNQPTDEPPVHKSEPS